MRILGIETSCDETAAAIVEDGTKVLSSAVASSQEIHKKYGGIIPEKAAREQLHSIIPVINETMKQFNNETIDALAVTVGPGLIGSLLVGVETARTLAWLWKKPIVPVNHLIAHIYANFLNQSAIRQLADQQLTIQFPALCLIVSGGHTELFLMKDHGKYQWFGGTRDDAAGECFDKCSRLLNLGYPGGPAIAAAAAKLKAKNLKLKAIKLPRPMLNQDNFDFSFSGLKTAVLNIVKESIYSSSASVAEKQQKVEKSQVLGSPAKSGVARTIRTKLAFEIQEAITDVLVHKTLKAAKQLKVKSILVGGGVAANERLREKFNNSVTQLFSNSIKLFIPPVKFCTDNASVIASFAYFNYQPVPWQKIKADPGLGIQTS